MATETIILEAKNFNSKREMYNKRRELKAQGWSVVESEPTKIVVQRFVPDAPVARPARRVSRRR